MATPKTTLAALTLVTPVLPIGTNTLSVDSSILPFVINADVNTVRLEVGIYNQTLSTNSFSVLSVGNVPVHNQFTTSVSLVPTVQETNVTIIGRNYDPNFTWQPNTSYAVGQRYADPNGNVEVVVALVGGSSGAIQPTWSTLLPVIATNVSVTNNVLTINVPNSFVAGQLVYLTGFQTATFLNGLVVTVATPGVIQFTAALPHADYPSTADLGTCQAATADSGLIWTNTGSVAVTPTVKFALLFFQSNLAVVIAPPSGLSANKNQNTCELQWVTPDYPGFIGVRVMLSTDPAGINPPFTQYGALITNVNSTTQTIIGSTSSTANNVPTAQVTNISLLNNLLTISAINTFVPGAVLEITGLVNAVFLNNEQVTVLDANGTSFTAAFTGQNYTSTPDTGLATSIVSTSITTNTNTVMTTDYSIVDIPSSFINNPIFYAMFSTVIQDPQTNALYESVQNGPLTAGFVNLQLTSPTDFPVLQRKEDIAGRLIAQILRQMPNLDLSPRSEIRDMFVDPFSIEASNMSVREWFARVSASISAISQVDDANGDGVSDSFQSSPYKQQIARAYGLSAQDTQNLIDEQFDILGEQAGLTRLAAATSTVVVTFYTYQQPQTSITIPQGAVVATVQDQNTPAVDFVTQGQAVIDITNLASFFNPQTGWWGVSVPAQSSTSGSVGNVGAGTIRQVVSGVSTGIQVTNLIGAQFGTDQEANSAFAARIQARLVTGVDSGSRHGYLVQALSTPGIIAAEVVAAGDLEMLRDWDPTRQKHVFGTVDIYTRGTTLSQQDEFVPFVYANNGSYGIPASYATLVFQTGNKFQIQNFAGLANVPYDAVELLVSRAASSFYLSLDRAQFDNVAGNLLLNLQDIAYQYVGNSITKAKVPLIINGIPATNQAAIAALSGASGGTYTLQLFLREKSPFLNVPTFQPVLQIYSVTGSATETGSIPSNEIQLIHTSDFLLTGGSNEAGDTVQITLVSQPTTSNITVSSLTVPTLIDIAMDQPLDANGAPLDVLSVRSTDSSTLYQFGVDYTILATAPYHQYGILPLTSSASIIAIAFTGTTAVITANNDFGSGAPITFSGITNPLFTVLNGQTIPIASVTPTQFVVALAQPAVPQTTATGTAQGSAIQLNQTVAVSYNKFTLYERLTLIPNEVQVLNGSLPTTLNNDGFVRNTWLPESYTIGVDVFPVTQLGFTLTLDGWNGFFGLDGGLDIIGTDIGQAPSTGLVGAQIPHDSRYIKITFNNGVTDVVMKENIDFTLAVDATSGSSTITRLVTGRIPDGGTVKVTYFVTETFTVSTQYPTFVEILANKIAQTKHAAADVLIKAMVANPVDITMAVTLKANTSPSAIDPVIRTVINIVLDNAQGTLFQSELISQVQGITGVQNVEIPLIKCAKSDGSYDIGVIVPTGTAWIRLGSDPLFANSTVPANSWISVGPILPDSTIPSGGEPTAIVDFLYEGQVFRRTKSVEDFLTNALTVPHLAVAPGIIDAAPGSFYIIGDGDQIDSTHLLTGYQQKVIVTIPADVPNPGNLSYFVTYQVFDENGAKDVTVSPTEYLAPGRITINYVTTG